VKGLVGAELAGATGTDGAAGERDTVGVGGVAFSDREADAGLDAAVGQYLGSAGGDPGRNLGLHGLVVGLDVGLRPGQSLLEPVKFPHEVGIDLRPVGDPVAVQQQRGGIARVNLHGDRVARAGPRRGPLEEHNRAEHRDDERLMGGDLPAADRRELLDDFLRVVQMRPIPVDVWDLEGGRLQQLVNDVRHGGVEQRLRVPVLQAIERLLSAVHQVVLEGMSLEQVDQVGPGVHQHAAIVPGETGTSFPGCLRSDTGPGRVGRGARIERSPEADCGRPVFTACEAGNITRTVNIDP
jgi:hypothetical protein